MQPHPEEPISILQLHRDPPAVHGLERQGLEDQQIQRAAEHIGVTTPLPQLNECFIIVDGTDQIA